MKKMIYMGALALIAAGGIFWSCQKDEFETNPENGLMLKKGVVQQAVSSVVNLNSPVCVGEEHTFTLEGWIGTKNIGVQFFDESIPGWVNVPGLPNGQIPGPLNFTFTFPAEGTYQMRYSVSGNKNEGGTDGQVDFEVNTVVCNSCDDANFSYETSNNLDIVFSYNHDEEAELTIQFTFPQVIDLELNDDNNYEAPDGKIYSVNNPTNQTVFTWTGVVGCSSNEPTTFEFKHAADCGPSTANDGQALIWTDAKIIAIGGVQLVDNPETEDVDESFIPLKGDLSNIVFTGCPLKTKG